MPAANWNGKFQAVGNGAFNGNIAYPAMMTALARGYATSSTDTGHTGGGAAWAAGHPEKVIDFGWRAVHEMTVASKKIIARYYGGAPKFSYWNGCSAGGRQAMKAAQRFPEDFDGIIAGAPGLDWTGRASRAVQVARMLETNEAARLSSSDTQVLHRAVLNACDAGDGVKDGLIADPKSCRFDPGCRCSARARSLVVPDAGAGRHRAVDLLRRGESRDAVARSPACSQAASSDGPSWAGRRRLARPDWINSGSWSSRIPAGTSRSSTPTPTSRAPRPRTTTRINALDPNLKPFIDRGGKLIQYHGWADPQISPENSTQYYTRVVKALGGADKVHGSYRLFMAPGMGHCGGGAGPNTFDMVTALEQWVEHGKAPDQILASHSSNGRRGPHAAALSLSTGRRLQGQREHRRRGQLRVQGTLARLNTHCKGAKTWTSGSRVRRWPPY